MRKYNSYKPLPTLVELLPQRSRIEELLADEPIDLVYIHGSVAKERVTPLSDLDLAIHFSAFYNMADLSRVIDKIEKALHVENIDFAILNKASPLLAMQVLQNGVCWFDRGNASAVFRLQTIKRYLATKHLRTQFNRYLDAAIGRLA